MEKLGRINGFTLIEVMIAMVILSLGLLGTLGMIATSIRGNAFSQQISIATSLATDKIEEMKNETYTVLDQIPPPIMGEQDVTNELNVVLVDVTPVDNGVNACPDDYPCGDLVAGDDIWTYVLLATIDNRVYNRIWTVELDPVVDGAILTSAMKLESIVSWVDGRGRPHKVRLATILTK
ncbi:MAG: prepilin-type N-terminal cleavage/methylation domain-containing protein [Nitrospira sp.]|nr:prepilin-type N-terminal cleavage/methylation domain-containing protein [Candidatus Manganitrophaceae bacterium]HIL34582.1 prepilin-type N-terminal cleavage/methylation domain-containing protein [Candidatus Manganitrophaceae bacterium]